MKYIKLADIKKILKDAKPKVSAVQRPALDHIESAFYGLTVYDFEEASSTNSVSDDVEYKE